MTDDKIRALAMEAREFASSSYVGKPTARELDKAILLIRRLADALEASTEAHERTKSGARTLGETIKQQCDDIVKITNSQDLIGDDGDGDWGDVWGRAFDMRAKLDALSALAVPDGDARPKVITEDGRHYAEFNDGDVIECSSPEDADATAEAWRRWPNGGHPPVDEHRGAWRTGFVDGAEWALSRAAAPEAVAKVRELHRPVEIEPSSTICHECSHQLPSGDYAEKVTEWPCATLDALGPAPEPEWEYGYELIEPDDKSLFDREGDFTSASFAQQAAKRRIHEERHPDVPDLQFTIVRRRKAGLWEPLPVEGETDG